MQPYKMTINIAMAIIIAMSSKYTSSSSRCDFGLEKFYYYHFVMHCGTFCGLKENVAGSNVF